MQGGLPIVVDGEVIGGIGASFATPEEDERVATRITTGLAKHEAFSEALYHIDLNFEDGSPRTP
jgi:Haem-degrading